MGSMVLVDVHVSRWVVWAASTGVPDPVKPMIGTRSAAATKAVDRTTNLFISSFISLSLRPDNLCPLRAAPYSFLRLFIEAIGRRDVHRDPTVPVVAFRRGPIDLVDVSEREPSARNEAHVRKTVLLLGVVASTLALSACGTTTKATIDQSVASLGAQSSVQIHLTGTAAGTATTQAQSILKLVSVDLNYVNPSGGPLSQATGTLDQEVTINVGSKTLADIRGIDGNDYLNIDLNPLSSLPGVNLPASELAALQLVIGGRWFEIPKSLIASVAHKDTTATKAQIAADVAIERKFVDAIAKVIDSGHAKALAGGGYAETGTIASIVKAVWPTISSLTKTTIPPAAAAVKGSYTLTLTTSGSTATGASITITSPGGDPQLTSVGLVATITHNSETISVPSGATVITPALLKQLETSGSTGTL